MVKLISVILCALMAMFTPPAQGSGEKSNQRDVPIIMYHSIYSQQNNGYVVSPKMLEKDIIYLKSLGYTPVFIGQLINFTNKDGDLPKKPIVLSFDDGFYNNYSLMLPLIKKYNFKSTVSLVGSFCQAEEGLKVRNNYYSYLNYKEISEMDDSGLVEFANHTYDWHKGKGKRIGVKQVSGESDKDYANALTTDLNKCSGLFKDKCGLDLKLFTYPYGFYSKQTLPILKELGYKAVLTCSEGINKIERGKNERLFWLKRYNRPCKYTTEYFFKNIVKLK